MTPEPARILTNAKVLTPAATPGGTDSVGMHGGRIVAVGSADSVAAAMPADHDTVDLSGSVIAPGFVDAHLHPLPMCFFRHHVDLNGCAELSQVLDLLADRAAATAPDGWVVGLALDDEALKERRLPTRAELDMVGGSRPVVILRRDGHHALGSSAALAAAGIDRTTPDPAGGVIHRGPDGEPTGLCGESASSMLMAPVPIPSLEELSTALDLVVAELASRGVTAISAICQTSGEGPAGEAGALEHLAWSMMIERVPFDVQTILIGCDAAMLTQLRDSPLHEPGAGRRLDAVKLFLDGTLGGRTACMHAPYADAASDKGMLTLDPDAAYARMVDAHTSGLQVCVHAIGDRANTVAVGLFERLAEEHPPGRGAPVHRIEHASVLESATVERMAAAGVAAVVQPISVASERAWLSGRLGPERLGHVYPFRSLLDAGVTVAGSSDAPIESTDVLAAVRCAVDRAGIADEEAISAPEALALYTTGASTVRDTAGVTGTLTPGARADVVVLSEDPNRNPERVEVEATIAAGRLVHGSLERRSRA